MRAPRSTKRQIASSVAAPTPLLPHFPRLFEGINDLGSSPVWVARTLARVAPLSHDSRVLDIAAGKGGVAVTIARRFNCSVELSDAYEPFVAAAIALANHRDVSHLCRARVADAADELARARKNPADAALMLNLWAFDRAIPALRRAVTPGGIYVFDDAVALRPAPASPSLPTIADVEAHIAHQGDRTLAREVRRRDALRATHSRLLTRLTANARAVARAHPRLKPHLAEFLRHHRAAGRLLEGELRPVLWVVRRCDR